MAEDLRHIVLTEAYVVHEAHDGVFLVFRSSHPPYNVIALNRVIFESLPLSNRFLFRSCFFPTCVRPTPLTSVCGQGGVRG